MADALNPTGLPRAQLCRQRCVGFLKRANFAARICTGDVQDRHAAAKRRVICADQSGEPVLRGIVRTGKAPQRRIVGQSGICIRRPLEKRGHGAVLLRLFEPVRIFIRQNALQPKRHVRVPLRKSVRRRVQRGDLVLAALRERIGRKPDEYLRVRKRGILYAPDPECRYSRADSRQHQKRGKQTDTSSAPLFPADSLHALRGLILLQCAGKRIRVREAKLRLQRHCLHDRVAHALRNVGPQRVRRLQRSTGWRLSALSGAFPVIAM